MQCFLALVILAIVNHANATSIQHFLEPESHFLVNAKLAIQCDIMYDYVTDFNEADTNFKLPTKHYAVCSANSRNLTATGVADVLADQFVLQGQPFSATSVASTLKFARSWTKDHFQEMCSICIHCVMLVCVAMVAMVVGDAYNSNLDRKEEECRKYERATALQQVQVEGSLLVYDEYRLIPAVTTEVEAARSEFFAAVRPRTVGSSSSILQQRRQWLFANSTRCMS